ncbi:MAG TPA: amino acid permease [Spirochaetota bacterium]|jgi:APA family basic amino acid/polyamine antiporter|nr:amino acid permease [Spirochaetota bacterium]HPV42906.1 amino acid permease [Spirochaetota bacterium]
MKHRIKRHLERKPIEELIVDNHEEHGRGLKRVLGPMHLTMLGVGVIVGAGIFVLTGQVAAQYTGPAIVLSFVISAVACGFAGLCYAEFASLIPVSGSAYTYAYATLGKLFAWIIGWDLILEYLFGASSVAVGWSGYVTSFLKDFGIVIPNYLASAPFAHDPKIGWYATGAVINLPAVLVVLIFTLLLILGIKESASFNNVIVVLKVTVILLFIGFGIFFIKMDNLTPFIPENTGNFGEYGWSGILRGAGVIFFAYIGFDVVSTAAQEVKNPKRDMPIGILGSLTIVTILYILVAFVLTGIVSYTQLRVPDPIAVGINSLGDDFFWLRPIVKLGAIAGLTSVVLVLLYGQSRIFYTMARDGMLPGTFAKVHSKYRTPYVTTLVTGAAAIFFSGLFPIGLLGEMVSIGTLLAFVIVCVSVMVLRYSKPKLHRPFKTPLMPFVPIMGALVSLAQMFALPQDTWMRLLVWMFIGFIIYGLYGERHARKKPTKPDDGPIIS